MGFEDERLILVAGARGTVGRRLVHALEMFGYRARCLSRQPDLLRRVLLPSTELMRADVLDSDSLRAAMKGVHTAYYLVHTMDSGPHFEAEDRRGARNFGDAAREAGVKRIIYLGALAHGEDLSTHLASRLEVGEILRESGVPVIEFRASIIIGAGSASFEMIRALIEKLPVMFTPKWLTTLSQPIGIHDVVYYLLGALELDTQSNEIFEIGGADRVAYVDLMREYARQRGLKRWVVPVWPLTPRMSSLWLAWLTPLQARVGRRLVEGVRHETVVEDTRALEIFDLRPKGMREAIAHELETEEQQFASARWGDLLATVEKQSGWGGVKFGWRLADSRAARVAHAPEKAFSPIRRIGGKCGWHFAKWLWGIRGLIDLLVGGVGMWRGRRDGEHLDPGDILDCWRVEAFEPDRLLRLVAEMKMPGRGWLQFEVESDEGGSTIRQTAIFDPVGVTGLVYWHGLYPIHSVVFAGMLRNIARAVERGERET